jgi:hypothetical protein
MTLEAAQLIADSINNVAAAVFIALVFHAFVAD